jgi:hypothetical protein
VVVGEAEEAMVTISGRKRRSEGGGATSFTNG